MINFFRKIRQNLLTERNTGKYLTYAFGEIILVVIGILIALQINNWNEDKKLGNDKMEFLNGIQNELQLDANRADTLINVYKKHLSYFNMVDPTYHLHNLDIVPLPDSSNVLDYNKLMHSPFPFKPNNGTYLSFMSYGSVKIVKNKELIVDLQKYYSIIEGFNSGSYDKIQGIESQLNWNRAYEKKYKPYKTIEDLKDKQFIAELNYFFDSIHDYLALLFYVKDTANELIVEIDSELKNN